MLSPLGIAWPPSLPLHGSDGAVVTAACWGCPEPGLSPSPLGTGSLPGHSGQKASSPATTWLMLPSLKVTF